MMRFFTIFFSGVLLASHTGCIQLNIPDSPGNQTVQYTLLLPSDSEPLKKKISVAEFVSESPAKFKMLSRQGTVQQFDSFAKWSQPPSVMVSSAFRKLYGIDDDSDAEYLLEGDILTFERNLDKKTADLKITYRAVRRSDREIVFRKELSSSVPLKGDSAADFAAAMSRAVVEQAGEIRKSLSVLK